MQPGWGRQRREKIFVSVYLLFPFLLLSVIPDGKAQESVEFDENTLKWPPKQTSPTVLCLRHTFSFFHRIISRVHFSDSPMHFAEVSMTSRQRWLDAFVDWLERRYYRDRTSLFWKSSVRTYTCSIIRQSSTFCYFTQVCLIEVSGEQPEKMGRVQPQFNETDQSIRWRQNSTYELLSWVD